MWSQPCPELKPDSEILPQRLQRDQRVRKQQNNILPQRRLQSIHESGGPGEGLKGGEAPNSHRLFIGNLPHEVDKSKLKDFFQIYGNELKLGRSYPTLVLLGLMILNLFRKSLTIGPAGS